MKDKNFYQLYPDGKGPGTEKEKDLLQKKRLTKEEREELEWANLDKNYNPDLFPEGFFEMIAEDWDRMLRKK